MATFAKNDRVTALTYGGVPATVDAVMQADGFPPVYWIKRDDFVTCTVGEGEIEALADESTP